ncbi:MAG: hypothetical protein WC370_08025 [Dehalococcoidales bacterium]|jgi:hypothetical protein
MQQENGHSVSRSAFLLLPVLALAFYIAFIPHQSYAYPLHIDEWLNLARTEGLQNAGTIAYPNVLSGGAPLELSSNMEINFQVFWAVFQRITGLSWLTIFRFFPSVILMFTALAAYVLTRRLGFGLEAAFFTCLIPTTVGILGPAFLLPVSLALPFVLLALFLAFYFQSWWSYLLIFVFTCFLVMLHPPSAVCLLLIVFPYALLNLHKGGYLRCLGIVLAVLVPFLAPFPWIYNTVIDAAKNLFTPQPLPAYVDLPMIIKTYGYIPVTLGLFGTFVLAVRRGKENFGLVLGLLVVSLMLAVFYTYHYGLSILYERGLLFMLLLLGIVAGAGLAWIKDIGYNRWLAARTKNTRPFRYAGWLACLALVGVTLFVSIPDHRQQPYYHMIDDTDYQAFVWIKDNLGPEYRKAAVDPWKATAFIAVTGKLVFSRIHEAATPNDEAVAAFLAGGCVDTKFLIDYKMSFVYTRGPCNNPDLVEVRDYVYVLKN